MERPTCLDNSCTSAFAGKSGARIWFSSGRSPIVSRPAFSGLFAISLPRSGLGRHRKLAARQSAIQGPIPDVVWAACVSLLSASFSEQERCAELGRARVSGLWPFGGLFLVGTTRSQRHVTPGRGGSDTGRAHYECDRS